MVSITGNPVLLSHVLTQDPRSGAAGMRQVLGGCWADAIHPCRNVLELIEFFEEEERFYLVFEKMRGGERGAGVGVRVTSRDPP